MIFYQLILIYWHQTELFNNKMTEYALYQKTYGNYYTISTIDINKLNIIGMDLIKNDETVNMHEICDKLSTNINSRIISFHSDHKIAFEASLEKNETLYISCDPTYLYKNTIYIGVIEQSDEFISNCLDNTPTIYTMKKLKQHFGYIIDNIFKENKCYNLIIDMRIIDNDIMKVITNDKFINVCKKANNINSIHFMNINKMSKIHVDIMNMILSNIFCDHPIVRNMMSKKVIIHKFVENKGWNVVDYEKGKLYLLSIGCNIDKLTSEFFRTINNEIIGVTTQNVLYKKSVYFCDNNNDLCIC